MVRRVTWLLAGVAVVGAVGVAAGIGAGDQGAAGPVVTVYKSPTCGCCSKWIDHMKAAGFEVRAVDLEDLTETKQAAGVPIRLRTCHTALVDGYVVEGHVPADLVQRLLKERPKVTGVAVPGMPMGSPGMEGPTKEPYDVLLFTKDGKTTVFAKR